MEFTKELINKFNEPGPYYSSYPVLSKWKDGVTSEQFCAALVEHLRSKPNEPTSFYIHIPFCAKLCGFCLCSVEITSNRNRIERFVDMLIEEIRMLRDLCERNNVKPNIREIHLGGGTPSYLFGEQLEDIMTALGPLVDAYQIDEFAMEIDPRTATPEKLAHYAGLGVNRISFGVQDFNAVVQQRVNRVQPYEMVRDLMAMRGLFRGVNFDLLYGLPMQTPETFRRTMDLAIGLRPDRVTLIKYAHAPDVRAHMKLIDEAELPGRDVLPQMFVDATQQLLDAGYLWVGIDNFALPSDDLAAAVGQGGAGRDFGGSTAGRTQAIVGLGPSSTHAFGRFYFQNVADSGNYTKAIQAGRFPTERGYELSSDDLVRRDIIFSLQGKHEVLRSLIERVDEAGLADHQNEVGNALDQFLKAGMVYLDSERLSLTPLGRYFIPHVCRLFDPHHSSGYRTYGPSRRRA